MANASEPRIGAALVIGVGEYAHAIGRLRFAVADAAALAKLLTDATVCGFPQDRVKLLTDKQADRDTVVSHLSKWLPEKSRGADLVVIYFAGHGMASSVGGDDEGYLLPYDADPDSPAVHGVAMSDLAKWVRGLDANAKALVCLDCCHAGLAVRSRAPDPEPVRRDFGIRAEALKKVAGRGRFLMAACRDDQQSVEDERLRHGLFTYHFLEGIKGAGDRDGDGQVRVSELFEYVHEKVVQSAAELGVSQQPWEFGSGMAGVYISSRPTAPPADGPPITPKQLIARLKAATEAELPELLKIAARLADPQLVPVLVPYFTDKWSKPVRGAARRAVKAIGTKRAHAAMEELARRHDPALAPVLDGLAALPARDDLVELLDRIVAHTGGALLIKATELLDRKRLGLGLKALVGLFAELKSEYEPKSVLGQGQFAAAYLAHDVETNMEVVVRVLRTEFVLQHEVRRQFLEACRLSKKHARHESLVRTIHVRAYPDRGTYFAVREHVDGVTLRDMLAGRPPETPPRRFTPVQGVEILRQLLGALGVLHAAGVVHGGVKPSNVFVCLRDRVVLGDMAPPILPMATGGRSAYPYRYLAPEVLHNEPAGAGADLYALGCIAYELFTGDPPFVSDKPGELTKAHLGGTVPSFASRGVALPSKLEILLLRLLMRNPSDRPDAETALAEIESIRELLRRPPDPDAAPPAGPPGPPPEGDGASGSVRLVRAESIADYRPARTLASAADDRSLASRPLLEAEHTKGVPSLPLPPAAQTLPPLPPIPNPFYTSAGPPTAVAMGGDSPTQPQGGSGGLPTRIGEYRVLGKLGEGGMGTVFLAEDERLGRRVAIKTLRPELAVDPRSRDRFEREARAAAAVEHDFIVPILHVGAASDGSPFIVMPLLQGESLEARLKREPVASLGLLLKVAREVAEGLAAAHAKGLIHRDIKPGNIWLEGDLSRPFSRCKILDFGLARLVEQDDSRITAHGVVLGTPAYMAPEQAEGARVDHRADLFSLGAVLYRMATGQQPFRGSSVMAVLIAVLTETPPSVRELNPNLPREVAALIDRLMCKARDGRPRSAAEVAEIVRSFGEPRATAAPPMASSPTEPVLDLGAWKGPFDSVDDIPMAEEIFDLDPEPEPEPLSLWERLKGWFRRKS